MKTVYLEWIDSYRTGSTVWVDKRDAEEGHDPTCCSVGFVVCEDKESITLAGHMDHKGTKKSGHVSGNMTIPKCAVRKRRIVRWKK